MRRWVWRREKGSYSYSYGTLENLPIMKLVLGSLTVLENVEGLVVVEATIRIKKRRSAIKAVAMVEVDLGEALVKELVEDLGLKWVVGCEEKVDGRTKRSRVVLAVRPISGGRGVNVGIGKGGGAGGGIGKGRDIGDGAGGGSGKEESASEGIGGGGVGGGFGDGGGRGIGCCFGGWIGGDAGGGMDGGAGGGFGGGDSGGGFGGGADASQGGFGEGWSWGEDLVAVLVEDFDGGVGGGR
ncbi:glycine-rich cell wall structural protein-like [Pyrus x bretschneideri]|uniref:glycine-rich cell wall structural protein-like n=1 Tax=Pyrus x bretschneideri TaxID=225117 RepID=UPI00202F6E88|nr:glycine-rich cell wall structural protein-like [Pyrus x bretschneideri]